ncbi:head-tail connector protein [Primorskyibacter sp. 2E107]|uniref:head-tail connector protein n=1 Tax=Primorskyibacter sp. 2E107 TaxID=3403458 RepID=UPI003AF7E5EC
MWLERISGGGVDLVDLDDAKKHLRLLEDDFDTQVAAAVRSASAQLDVDTDGFGGLGFPIVSQAWSAKGSGFTDQVLRLPFPRVSAITEIRYTDPDGAAQVVPSSDYLLTRDGRGAVVVLLSGKSWPSVIDRPDAVDLRFVAGFADVASVPDDIVEAAKQLIGFYFEHRGAEPTAGVAEDAARCVDDLTRRYRRFAM